jgi:hypothetical protein
MKTKEKAEELFKKYILICNNWSLKFIEFKTNKELKQELNQKEWFIPKQCALIVVDEVINNLPLITEIQEYWIEVKQEIEKL